MMMKRGKMHEEPLVHLPRGSEVYLSAIHPDTSEELISFCESTGDLCPRYFI